MDQPRFLRPFFFIASWIVFALGFPVAAYAGRWDTGPSRVDLAPDRGVMTIMLPGDVPLMFQRVAADQQSQCAKGRAIVPAANCYAMSAPLTNGQWQAIMGRPRGANADAELAVRTLSIDDVLGDKGVVAELNSIIEKLSPGSGVRVSLPVTAPTGAAGSGPVYSEVRLVATVATAKNLRPVPNATCSISGAQSMSCNTTRNGMLTGSDCTLDDGSYADVYAFTGTAGDEVTIDMTSSDFDTFLLLFDPNGDIAAYDDDSGDLTDSQIRFTLDTTGTWTIIANSTYAGYTGSYVLHLVCGAAVMCSDTATSCGLHNDGTLSSSDCVGGGSVYVDVFHFNGVAGQTVTIDMTSTEMDPYLVLVSPTSTAVAEDDDSGDGMNARIVYTIPTSGVWKIRATSYVPWQTGAYQLTVGCSGASTCTYSLGSSTASYLATGGSGTVQVTGAPAGCTGSWTSTSNASWIGINSGSTGSGQGPFTLSYSVGSNAASTQRTGTMTVAGNAFTVMQAGTGSGGVCVPSATQACLLGGRYKATLRYRGAFDNQPADTNASVKPVQGFGNPNYETVFFFFNSENNIEVMLKMLDQGNVDDQQRPTMAVLFGTATPLRVELTIIDTANNATRTYTSEFNAMQGVTDFTAFLK